MDKDKLIDAADALAQLGMSTDEVDEADADLLEKRARGVDRQVCVCGHGAARHTVSSGVVYCKPSRMECPCKKLRPVLLAEDTRLFIRKTDGQGPAHALSRGIRESANRGRKVSWIVDLVCDRCGTEADRLSPTAVSQRGVATDYATGYDALLCNKCRTEV